MYYPGSSKMRMICCDSHKIFHNLRFKDIESLRFKELCEARAKYYELLIPWLKKQDENLFGLKPVNYSIAEYALSLDHMIYDRYFGADETG
jgi:hypothetical protein